MRRLDNPDRDYDWGSASAIPSFMRRDGNGARVAEVWMGTHPSSSSMIAGEPATSLRDVAGELPFMLKILAAERPLSIQVHPNRQLAQAGFAREEGAGIPMDAPHRVYKDPHPKPEMVYAITEFDTLVGFRPTAEILRILAAIQVPRVQGLVDDLRRQPGFLGIVRTVEKLLSDPPSAQEVADIVAACAEAERVGIDIKRAYATAIAVHEHHPGDVGVVMSLLLNRVTLQPGEAAYLGTGIIHAHLSGLCVEVMVASDNVLRAGLTSKHLDPNGLVQCLDQGMSRVVRVTPDQYGFSTDIYSPGLREFSLSITQCSAAEPDGAPLPDRGRRIVVCLGGDVVVVNARGDEVRLERGDALFADADDGALRARGTGEVAQAYTPEADQPAGALTDLI